MRTIRPLFSAFLGLLLASLALKAEARATFTMAQVLHYPYATELASAEKGDAIAWVRNVDGVRNVWFAHGPDFAATQLTHYTEDDGQELTQLIFSPDGTRLVYVRGGDHDANWPAEGNLAPDPNSSPEQPLTTIWTVPLTGGAPVKIAEGDTPAISSRGQLAYTKDDHVWSVGLSGEAKPERLFFDRGKDSDLQWSPDGSRLAFVSNRGDHAFIGVFTHKEQPLVYLAPSTGKDLSPRWSPDGARIAFVRRPGDGGAPEPVLKQTPHPWAIWVANAADAVGHVVWQSPVTLAGSYPEVAGEANLHWGDGDRLVFLSYLDEWPHLYSIAARGVAGAASAGGTGRADGAAPTLLTPGAFMVEHGTESRDRRFMVYSANTGATSGDGDRRHLFKVPVDHPGAEPLTSGESLEWQPVIASDRTIAFVASGAQQPPAIAVVGLDGKHRTTLDVGPLPSGFPVADLVTPKPVTFRSEDGTLVHGQVFEQGSPGAGHASSKPGIVFVHG